MSNEIANPYPMGDTNWISIEWDKLCNEQRDCLKQMDKIQITSNIDEADKVSQKLKEIQIRKDEFREMYFLGHQ
jgi:hypothetical protein